jgi:hypothetical protein
VLQQTKKKVQKYERECPHCKEDLYWSVATVCAEPEEEFLKEYGFSYCLQVTCPGCEKNAILAKGSDPLGDAEQQWWIIH